MSQDDRLELARARYGLFAVVLSNLAIAAVAVFGVWRLDGDKSVIVGVLTSAFTAVGSMTTAYLGIKAVSNTAQSIAQQQVSAAQATAAPSPPPAGRTAPAQSTPPPSATSPAPPSA